MRKIKGYNQPEPIKPGDRVLIADKRGLGFDDSKFYRVAKVEGKEVTTRCGRTVARVSVIYAPTPGEIRRRAARCRIQRDIS